MDGRELTPSRPLSKRDLLDRVLTAIELSGWDALIISDEHPFLLRASKPPSELMLRVYVWNLTPGGPRSVRPEDEWRIQITGIQQLSLTPGETTLLLGWHEGVQVFVGFDPWQHRRFGRSPSIQVRGAAVQDAAKNGLSVHRRNSRDLAIAFKPDQFMNYALNQAALHEFKRENEALALEAAATESGPDITVVESLPRERQAVILGVQRWMRERRFREEVLRAYRRQCAVCRIQLKLVDAAHIVPVSVPGSTDEVRNGLCLCPLHHRAFDAGLLLVYPDYHIRVNRQHLANLRREGVSQGEESMSELECNTIWVPERPEERPAREYLHKRLSLHGIPV
ncbi:hypothetical protein HRbin24_00585 [bacterium HR24]|nr:hypothetical protein HRbin24_00585 [bacterium HR24]